MTSSLCLVLGLGGSNGQVRMAILASFSSWAIEKKKMIYDLINIFFLVFAKHTDVSLQTREQI